jgi:hypothetical protein
MEAIVEEGLLGNTTPSPVAAGRLQACLQSEFLEFLLGKRIAVPLALGARTEGTVEYLYRVIERVGDVSAATLV